jgi:voltage-gated potassium channel
VQAPAADQAMLALLVSGAAQNGVFDSWAEVKRELREGMNQDPLDALAVTVLGGSFLFYMAEKDENPKVQTYVDALVFISTCLSVGYADVFAKTQAGKAIATAVMMVGPAMAAKALDPPAPPPAPPTEAAPATERTRNDDAAVEVQRVIAEKLDAILEELRKGR